MITFTVLGNKYIPSTKSSADDVLSDLKKISPCATIGYTGEDFTKVKIFHDAPREKLVEILLQNNYTTN